MINLASITDKNYLKKLQINLAWEHWPDTRAFITRSIELWNTCSWIRLSCYVEYILHIQWIHM